MSYSKLTFKLSVSAFFVLLAAITFQLLENFSDPYDTDKFYLAWVSGLQDVSFEHDFFKNLYLVSFQTIKAPEPITHIFMWCFGNLTSLSATTLLSLLSIFVIFLLASNIPTKPQEFLVTFLILLYLTSFSYYWFVLFEITHRLKLSIIFLIISITAKKYRYSNLSSLLLLLSIFTHFSVILMLPIFFYFRKYNFNGPELEEKQFLIWLLGGILFLFLLFSVFLIGEDFNDFTLLIINKLPFINKSNLIIIIGSCIFYIFYKKYFRSEKFTRVVALVFLVVAINFLGTSRILMLVMLACTLVVLFNPDMIFLKTYKLHISKMVFLTILCWDIFRYVEMVT
ncbi:hypothetical protein N9427_00985 [Paracoccaceae bacterium]|nr:hypothetical protein [Paracoccaceae bacterium]